MKRHFKNLISILLVIILITSSIPFSVYANDDSVWNSETTTVPYVTEGDESQLNPEFPSEPDVNSPDDSNLEPDENNGNENFENEDEYAPPETEEELNNKEQALDSKLDETENQLSQLTEGDQQYMDLLDQKIGVVNAQLMIYDNQVIASRGNIASLQLEIEPMLEELEELEAQYNYTKSQYDSLNDLFKSTYQKYCSRVRALYVTGETSIISILLGSKDISEFLVRMQLISVMSKRDGEFMQEVDRQMQALVEMQNGLAFQKDELDIKTQELMAKLDEQKVNQDNILAKQEKITQKKLELSLIRAKYPPTKSSGEGLVYNSNDVLNLTYPVPNQHSLSLGYGHYSDGRPHRALDFPLSIGSRVVAAQKGVVLKAVDLGNRSYGKYVMIYHGTDIMGREIVTLYAHNSELLVTPGQSVEKGQQIAKGGSTGNSTGPHCHFELRVDNKLVNPTYFLS